jgi:hypothetical protein
MWTPTAPQRHSREHLRYASDLTDAEWLVLEPHLPSPRATGRPRAWPMREIMNAIFYLLHSGCVWRSCPTASRHVRPSSAGSCACATTACWSASIISWSSPTGDAPGARPVPRRGKISQSVKTTEAGGPRGYDAGKKIKGRKRHALVDTDGRGLVLEPHSAGIQDRDGGGPLLAASRHAFPFIEGVFADGG